MSDKYELNPINDFCNSENSKLLVNRISNMPIVERIEASSMSQMFSFWKEIQDTLIAAAEEIKKLNKRIEELENANK